MRDNTVTVFPLTHLINSQLVNKTFLAYNYDLFITVLIANSLLFMIIRFSKLFTNITLPLCSISHLDTSKFLLKEIYMSMSVTINTKCSWPFKGLTFLLSIFPPGISAV